MTRKPKYIVRYESADGLSLEVRSDRKPGYGNLRRHCWLALDIFGPTHLSPTPIKTYKFYDRVPRIKRNRLTFVYVYKEIL